MTDNTYKSDALLLKAFSDENRLKIIEQIKDGEVCACFILNRLTITQSTLSHHMKILVDSGIVNARRDGKWTRYSLSNEGIQRAKGIIEKVTTLDEDEAINRECRKKHRDSMHNCRNHKELNT